MVPCGCDFHYIGAIDTIDEVYLDGNRFVLSTQASETSALRGTTQMQECKHILGVAGFTQRNQRSSGAARIDSVGGNLCTVPRCS